MGTDPQIDAYIRWQLTSFDPPLPQMTERTFERLLGQLPPLVENPRSDRQLITMLNASIQTRPLPTAAGERLAAINVELKGQTAEARIRMRPALELRTWLQGRVGKSGSRALKIRLELCAALVTNGWEIDRALRDLGKCFEASADAKDFPDSHRRRIVELAYQLVTPGRQIVRRIRVEDDFVLVDFGISVVDDFVVRSWVKKLAAPDR